MFTYTFQKLDKMGDPHETYGQAYWGTVNEELRPVKFNSSNENITAEDTIECEEQSEKKSAKGTVYLQLKKVRVVQGGTGMPTDSGGVVQADDPRINHPPTQSQLDRIEEKLDKLLGIQKEVEENIPPDFLTPEED